MGTPALRMQIQSSLGARFGIDFTIRERNALEALPTGMADISIPRGTLTEICGPPSSGRTSILYATLRGLPAAPNSALSSTRATTSIRSRPATPVYNCPICFGSAVPAVQKKLSKQPISLSRQADSAW
jgi:hypothetical protein